MVAFDAEKSEDRVKNGEDLSTETTTLPHPLCRNTGTSIITDQHRNAQVKMQDQLLKLASLALKQSEQDQPLNLPLSGNEVYIGMSDRDSAVSSIRVMQRFYNFGTDTFATAIEYMDRFLSKVKVKRRYLSCISAGCFYLSAKMNEESEDIPSASELSSIHREVWKPSDLKRMEKLVLDKLSWNLFPSTSALAFLEVMLDVLQRTVADIDEDFLTEVVERLELFLNYSVCCQYKSSTLALATLHQCLKVFNISTTVSRLMMLQFQTACQVSDSELFDCQCAISQQFELHHIHSLAHPPCLPLPKIAPHPNLVNRPSCYGNTDLPTIEEVSWDNEIESSEEDSESPTKVKTYADVVKEGKFVSSVCLLNEQCFVGKIGAAYSDFKCNITQA